MSSIVYPGDAECQSEWFWVTAPSLILKSNTEADEKQAHMFKKNQNNNTKKTKWHKAKDENPVEDNFSCNLSNFPLPWPSSSLSTLRTWGPAAGLYLDTYKVCD